MSLSHLGFVLLFIVLFLTGLLVIIRSKQINNWVFNMGARFLKSYEIPNAETQRVTSLWIIRIFAGLFTCFCIVFLYFLLSDIHW